MEATDAGQEGSRAGERRMSNEDVTDTKEDRMSDAAMISKTGGRRQSGDYAALQNVLDEAFLQSAEGKGNARHANDKPFDKQPILEIGRMVGPGFAAGQIMKKAQEAIGMAARGETEAAANELLGAIVYAASAVVLVREKGVSYALAANAGLIEGWLRSEEKVAAVESAARLIEPDVAPRPFKVGDRVRIAPGGLRNGSKAAGCEAVITAPWTAGRWRLRVEKSITTDCGSWLDEWTAEVGEIVHVD